jgi:hypothetical protein
LEQEKVTLESNLLQLKFEKEELVAAASKKAPAKLSIPATVVPALPAKVSQYDGRSKNELLQIIDQLSKVIDKFKAENDDLKRVSANQIKNSDAIREVKRLKKELDQAIDERKNVDMYIKQSHRLEEESAKTRKQLKKELQTNSTLTAKNQELIVTSEQMKKELVILRKKVGAATGVNLEDLDNLEKTVGQLKKEVSDYQAQIEEKNTMIQKLMNPEEGPHLHLTAEIRKQGREIELWKSRALKLTADLADGQGTTDDTLKVRLKSLEKENTQLKGITWSRS